MRAIAIFLAFAAMLPAACGGDDDNGGSASTAGTGAATGGSAVVIQAADADRVAHAGLPAVEDLPGDNWIIVAEDDFDSGSGAGFLEFIEGNPACATLENLTTLQGVFGGDEGPPPLGQAQREFEEQSTAALVPTTIEVSIEIEDSASNSQGAFALVRQLFESDETSDCIISVLNEQFVETGPAGIQLEVSKGSASARPPQNGATMAFDMDMAFAGFEISMTMQMYFWPYGNATVQALFLGTDDSLTSDLVGSVLQTIDAKLRAAAE